jgi:hypothetical protein
MVADLPVDPSQRSANMGAVVMGGAVKAIGQSKRGGGDRSSRPAQVQARENEQKALALWLKGATCEQVAAAGFGITTASGAWRAVRRALVRIPKKEADEAREAQLARLQALGCCSGTTRDRIPSKPLMH